MTDLRVHDIVRVYTAPYAGQRARVVYFYPDTDQFVGVELLEPVVSQKVRVYLPGESVRVPVGKCRQVGRIEL